MQGRTERVKKNGRGIIYVPENESEKQTKCGVGMVSGRMATEFERKNIGIAHPHDETDKMH